VAVSRIENASPVADAHAFGKELRSRVKRSAHAKFESPDRDPVAILEQQNESRLDDLVPVRIGRMLQSRFAYYRGTAGTMAHDLAAEDRTGFNVTGCGDAHVANFGLFASPDRRVLFDLNDFDEAGPCPWEWDVKRLACSVEIGFRHRGFSSQKANQACEAAVRTYRETMRELEGRSALERYYFRVEVEDLESIAKPKGRKILERAVRRARKRTSDRVLNKITATDLHGHPRIVDEPPILRHFSDISLNEVRKILNDYQKTLRPDVATLISQFRVADYALRVVGVGSVGTRCFIALMIGPSDIPLFLQVKQAQPSVLETYGGIRPQPLRGVGDRQRKYEGYRVVSSQQVLQAASDVFLGWIRTSTGVDFYVRQFRDMKGSVDLDRLPAEQFEGYGRLCGRLLARAHSQTPASAVIAGYLGKSDVFDRAIAAWSKEYADQTERDFEALEKAVRSGRLPAETGL
jgi:uncharacterized protein (DUF2252 family)